MVEDYYRARAEIEGKNRMGPTDEEIAAAKEKEADLLARRNELIRK
jgi:hypothetical protein